MMKAMTSISAQQKADGRTEEMEINLHQMETDIQGLMQNPQMTKCLQRQPATQKRDMTSIDVHRKQIVGLKRERSYAWKQKFGD